MEYDSFREPADGNAAPDAQNEGEVPLRPLDDGPAITANAGYEESDEGYPELVVPFVEESAEDDTVDADVGNPPEPPLDGPPPRPGAGDSGGDNDRSSVVLTDRMFDVLAAGPPTQAQQERVREVVDRSFAINWLGGGSTLPYISLIFGKYGPSDLHGTLTSEVADQVVARQLSQFSATLAQVRDGTTATAELGAIMNEFADRGVLEERELWEPYPGAGIPMGQYRVHPNANGFLILDGPPNEVYGELWRYDRPDGEVRLVRPNAQERYVISQDNDTTTVKRQTLHTLSREDIAYLADMHTLLSGHERLLLAAAAEAGYDPGVLTGDYNDEQFLKTREEYNAAIRERAARDEFSPGLRERLGASAIVLWTNINGVNPGEGLSYPRSTRIREYFYAILRQLPAEQADQGKS